MKKQRPQTGDWAKASGGDQGVVFDGRRYQSFACLYCAVVDGVVDHGRRIPMTDAAFKAIKAPWTYPCKGAGHHNRFYQMKVE